MLEQCLNFVFNILNIINLDKLVTGDQNPAKKRGSTEKPYE
jgi:hypothetical protein